MTKRRNTAPGFKTPDPKFLLNLSNNIDGRDIFEYSLVLLLIFVSDRQIYNALQDVTLVVLNLEIQFLMAKLLYKR